MKIKKWSKSVCLLIFLSFLILFGSCLIQLKTFPPQIHISPGQALKLSVHYPLSLYSLNMHKNLRNLNFQSVKSAEYVIQLRIFGRIPVKRFRVTVEKPTMVIPGGQAVGVLYSSRGVVIVGHVPLKGADSQQYYPAREAGVKIGDILLAINRTPVNLVEEVEEIVRHYRPKEKGLSLTILRNDQLYHLTIEPVLVNRSSTHSDTRYMMGILIEDPAAGVGTLSFLEPISRKFAGLGHRISDFAGRKEIPFRNGEIVLANITGLRAGTPGRPGEKIGLFNVNLNPIGKILRNSEFGIYGRLYHFFPAESGMAIPIAFNSEVKEGPAKIYTVIKGITVEHFDIDVIKVYHQDNPRSKGLIIKVTDPRLIRLTGGIIQGMSGSPIVQNGKLIGAVTHVFVNDPTKGYGILAEWMIDELNKKSFEKAS